MPNAASTASRCGAPSASTRPSKGRSRLCSPANGSTASDCTPVTLRTSIPRLRAPLTASPSSADLPMPGPPLSTSEPP